MNRHRLLGTSAVLALTAALGAGPALSASAGSHSVADVWPTQQQCLWDQNQLKHQGYQIAYPCYGGGSVWIVQYYV
jgi:nitrous oxide reductase